MPEVVADAGTAISIGRRDRQEDAVIADFPRGASLGLAVLSDGMGGHEDGNVASRVIVAAMFSELFFQGGRSDDLSGRMAAILSQALHSANESLRDHLVAGLGREGMGGTAIAAALLGHELHWISVGDSLLLLWRDGTLKRLNQDHSMAAEFDAMVSRGVMDAATARTHPERNMLTSALTGKEIRAVDCPEAGLPLQSGDLVVIASDGLQTLEMPEVRRVLRRTERLSSTAIAEALIDAVVEQGEADQDNISVAVISVREQAAEKQDRSVLSPAGFRDLLSAPKRAKQVLMRASDASDKGGSPT